MFFPESGVQLVTKSGTESRSSSRHSSEIPQNLWDKVWRKALSVLGVEDSDEKLKN